MKVLASDAAGLMEAAELLRAGSPVGMPTETVYGLAARFDDLAAVAAVYEAKDRPSFDPLIVHIAHPDGLSRLVCLDAFSPTGLVVLQQLVGLWPGPLTLVLPKSEEVSDLVTAGLSTVAVRCPEHPVARELVKQAGSPLVAPSANRFGHVSPTRASHVQEELGGRVPAVVDGGPCQVGIESTILSVDAQGRMTLLRPGVLSREDLCAMIGPVQVREASEAVTAPGQMDRHYAPRARLVRLPGGVDTLTESSLRGWAAGEGRPLALLCISPPEARVLKSIEGFYDGPVYVRVLAPDGCLATAAQNLFAHLRELDALEPEVILSEEFPGETGLAHAIRDRLCRASRGRHS